MYKTLLLLLTTLWIAEANGQKTDTSHKAPINMQDIIVTADKLNKQNTVSEIVINNKMLKTTTGHIQDPLRVVSTMPGVARGGDLFNPSFIYVRGGAPEENLFMLNNARIYFPFYFGGQKSIFNADVIDNIELLTGGFSAKYGNALSSVLNVSTRDGSREKYKGNLSLGFYNSQLLAEGPISKNVSFLVAARRTYLDLFLKERSEFPVPNFGDLTYKVTWFAGKKHKINLSGVSGREKMDFLAADPTPGLPDRIKTDGNSNSQSLQWQYASNKLYSKLSLINSFQQSIAGVGNNLGLDIKGAEYGLREDAEYKLNKNVQLMAGFEIYNSALNMTNSLPLDPRDTDPSDTTVRLINMKYKTDYTYWGTYVSTRVKVTKKTGFEAGVRYDHTNNIANAVPSPRLSAYYSLSRKTEIRLAYTHNYQFPSPEAIDRNKNLSLPKCVHYVAGIKTKLTNSISGWVELYRKEYDRLVTFDTLLNYANDGSGYAQGVEFFMKKHEGKLTGWISYAYSTARRRSNLDDKEYYFDYDQRHIFNLAFQYNTNKPKKKSMIFVPDIVSMQTRVESGRPFTPITGALNTPVGWSPVKGEINSERNPGYLNINLRADWVIISTKKITITSYFEIWNLTNSKNVLGRSYQYGNNYANNVKEQEYYTTPLLPAGGFAIQFN